LQETLLCVALSLSGCATLAAQSVGFVPCREDEITTSNVHYSDPGEICLLGAWGLPTWDATCRGQTYVCSQHATPQESQTACSRR
jgi:hypothetical protein